MTQTREKTTSNPASSLESVIIARDIRRVFRMGDAEIEVLKDVNLSVRKGEFLAIEGRSGSGKSTLLHILGALDGVDRGSVSYVGRDYTRPSGDGKSRIVRILSHPAVWWSGLFGGTFSLLIHVAFLFAVLLGRRWNLTWMSHDALETYAPALRGISVVLMWASSALVAIYLTTRLWHVFIGNGAERVAADLRNNEFGFVFQFYHLLPELNVLENTLLGSMVQHSCLSFMGNRAALRKRAEELLDQLGMAHRLKHRPSQLSGGERQRVAIARALMNSPKVLFADEPTGNLDVETGRQIMAVLEKLHQQENQTIIMVTHDRSLARQADRVLVLKDGKLEKAE